MELKDIYTKIEATEGGADLVAAIKGEIEKLNAEAKKTPRSRSRSQKRTGNCCRQVWRYLRSTGNQGHRKCYGSGQGT